MSRAGAAERGFTLIELLVVLTIVALLAARGAAAGAARCCGPTSTGPPGRWRWRSATSAAPPCAPGSWWPRHRGGDRAAAAERDRAGRRTGLGEAGLMFFPNGTSTGGRVVLAAVDGRRAVNVDWLTGRVTVTALP